MRKLLFLLLAACGIIASCKKHSPAPAAMPGVLHPAPEGKVFSFIGLMDGHTAGVGGRDSYIDMLRPMLKEWYGDGGPGLQMFDDHIAAAESVSFEKSPTLMNMNLLAFDSAPTKFSINGMGLYSENANDLSFTWQSKGKVKYEKARIFYLKQPGGGSFKVGFMDQATNTYSLVRTDSAAFSLAYIDLVFNSSSSLSYNIKCSSINGKVGLFGVIFSNPNGAMYSRIAQEGMTLANIMKLSSDFRKAWYKTLNPVGVYFDAGTNDRKTVDAQTFGGWLRSYSNDVLSSSKAKMMIVHGIQPKDHASTYFDDYLAVQKDVPNSTLVNLSFYIGDYDSLSAKGWMLDDTYLNDLGNSEKYVTFFNNMSYYFPR
jgi:hypothetical protein